jgi:hypothetical protein
MGWLGQPMTGLCSQFYVGKWQLEMVWIEEVELDDEVLE